MTEEHNILMREIIKLYEHYNIHVSHQILCSMIFKSKHSQSVEDVLKFCVLFLINKAGLMNQCEVGKIIVEMFFLNLTNVFAYDDTFCACYQYTYICKHGSTQMCSLCAHSCVINVYMYTPALIMKASMRHYAYVNTKCDPSVCVHVS